MPLRVGHGGRWGQVTHGDAGQEIMTASWSHASLTTGNEVNCVVKDRSVRVVPLSLIET